MISYKTTRLFVQLYQWKSNKSMRSIIIASYGDPAMTTMHDEFLAFSLRQGVQNCVEDGNRIVVELETTPYSSSILSQYDL